jgi:hypothetical protein
VVTRTQQSKPSVEEAGEKAKRTRHAPNHAIHEEHCRAKNDFSELQKRTKEEHWKEYLESVDEGNIWDS